MDHDRDRPIDSVIKIEFYEKLDLSKHLLRRTRFIEHRATLMDELFQLVSSPKEFSYLNTFQEGINVISENHYSENNFISFAFDLALEVKIENRTVNSISGMFGNVVGTKDFLVSSSRFSSSLTLRIATSRTESHLSSCKKSNKEVIGPHPEMLHRRRRALPAYISTRALSSD